MENLDLESYLQSNYPDIFGEYLRYLGRHILPQAGDRVCTLRSGFGGAAGVIRKIFSIDSEHIILCDNNGYSYQSNISDWYKDFVVLKD